MKKIFKYFASALLLAGFVFVSCSKDDTVNLAPEEDLDTYTLTVNATKQPLSKALDLQGTTLYAKWAAGDEVTVYKGEASVGTLTATTVSSDGLQATFTGSVSTSVEAGNSLVLKYQTPSYAAQNGTIAGISSTCDYAEAAVTVESIDAGGNMTTSKASFESKQAIVEFKLKDNAGNALTASQFTVKAEGMADIVVDLSGGANDFYVAIPGVSSKTLTLEAVVGTETYTYQKSAVTFENSKFYGVNVNMFNPRFTPLTISAKEDGTTTITVKVSSVATNGITYEINNLKDPSYVIAGGAEKPITVNKGDKVTLFGDNAGYYNFSSESSIQFDKDCYVYGNIMSLIDPDNYSVAYTITAAQAFMELFKNNTHLLSHSWKKLVLPAKTLSISCYAGMFFGCTSLTTAPDLDQAATVPNTCYYEMFRGCSNLTAVPKIDFTSVGYSSCSVMFQGCTSLPEAPRLPATSLGNECYTNMFSGCTGIQTLPSDMLPATTLAPRCYWGMFNGCTGITTIPSGFLPATTLAEYCYYNMFYNCTGLQNVPSDLLPATTLADNCYERMFASCSKLTKTPGLSASTLAKMCYSEMFWSCSKLTDVPTNLPASTLADECYNYMFQYCTSLTTVPYLPATTLANGCYKGMFSNCTSLTTVPSNLLSAASVLAEDCYNNMFCKTHLTAAPELPATTLAPGCYAYMFAGDNWGDNPKFTTAPELPATTLAPRCYEYMFQYCKQLTTAPDLPATTLVEKCYNRMFNNCRNLNYIKCLATDISASDCTTYWVDGVNSTGTFVKAASVVPDWTTGANGIPSGWTVN